MKLDDYQKQAKKTVLPEADNIYYFTLGLTNEAGEVAGKVKKWIRDHGGNPKKLDKKMIGDELGDTLWYVAMLAEHLGLSLEEIAGANLAKLRYRAKEGKLTGDGDYR